MIAGQSNAEGIGQVADLSGADVDFAQPYPEARYQELGGAWRDLSPRTDGTFGVELTLGRALPPGSAVDKVAIGATSLAYDWRLDGPLFARLVSGAAAAEVSQGMPVSAVVWIQGERDASDAATAQAYGDNLIAFVDAVRARFPAARFVLNRLHGSFVGTGPDMVRAGQERTAHERPDVVVITADDLAMQPASRAHFTSQSYLELGRRFAAAIEDR
ncbi:MAG: hypothetical protein QOI20_3266 [Acidimicrobiaceae bacterium]|nr:hypothetical protein [Acidimicrobiaceae bacterium]